MKKFLALCLMIIWMLTLSGYGALDLLDGWSTSGRSGGTAGGKYNNDEEDYIDVMGQDDDAAEDLAYYAASYHWENGGEKLAVEGSFYNLGQEYDMFQFEYLCLVVMDQDDNVMKIVNVNRTVADNLVLGPGQSYPYNFTCKLSSQEMDFPVVRMECAFQYAPCGGSGCGLCGGMSAASGGSPGYGGADYGDFGNDDADCSYCGGVGKCLECAGTGDCFYAYGTHPCINGRIDLPTGEITCTQCDGSGRCVACGGSGRCPYCGG